VTGRIVQRGDQLIISTELIDARTNRNLWGDQYDRKLSDVLTVQQDITGAIASKLRERLAGDSRPQLTKGGTADAEAYQLYLKGRYYWQRRTRDSLEKSKDYFNQAIERDPGYAMAYVGLAQYYFVVPDYAPVSNSEATLKLQAAAEKALAIAPDLADAHTVLAGSYWNNWKWDQAENEFKRALQLDPHSVDTHHWYGLFLSWGERDEEATAQMNAALALDPLNLRVNTNLAQVYWGARQDDRAFQQIRKTIELDPNFADVHDFLGICLRATGKYDEWLAEWKRNAELTGDHEYLAINEAVAKAYRQSGFQAANLKQIELLLQLNKRRYVDPGDIAALYAAARRPDDAFLWWNKAVDDRSGSIQTLQVRRDMDPYRSDPRYANLLKRVGLSH
jgi:Tfp pilus assembly protein PilF